MNEEENINQSADNDQSSTEENKTIEQPATESNQLQTKEMDVHHPYNVTHKKKWAEYFLEFFMLFLAVFLGFVAENIREHNVEKDKEKVYMQNVLDDLKADTVIYNNYAKNNKVLFGLIDTLIHILKALK